MEVLELLIILNPIGKIILKIKKMKIKLYFYIIAIFACCGFNKSFSQSTTLCFKFINSNSPYTVNCPNGTICITEYYPCLIPNGQSEQICKEIPQSGGVSEVCFDGTNCYPAGEYCPSFTFDPNSSSDQNCFVIHANVTSGCDGETDNFIIYYDTTLNYWLAVANGGPGNINGGWNNGSFLFWSNTNGF
jgi:hypothetical protein